VIKTLRAGFICYVSLQ